MVSLALTELDGGEIRLKNILAFTHLNIKITVNGSQLDVEPEYYQWIVIANHGHTAPEYTTN